MEASPLSNTAKVRYECKEDEKAPTDRSAPNATEIPMGWNDLIFTKSPRSSSVREKCSPDRSNHLLSDSTQSNSESEKSSRIRHIEEGMEREESFSNSKDDDETINSNNDDPALVNGISSGTNAPSGMIDVGDGDYLSCHNKRHYKIEGGLSNQPSNPESRVGIEKIPDTSLHRQDPEKRILLRDLIFKKRRLRVRCGVNHTWNIDVSNSINGEEKTKTEGDIPKTKHVHWADTAQESSLIADGGDAGKGGHHNNSAGSTNNTKSSGNERKDNWGRKVRFVDLENNLLERSELGIPVTLHSLDKNPRALDIYNESIDAPYCIDDHYSYENYYSRNDFFRELYGNDILDESNDSHCDPDEAAAQNKRVLTGILYNLGGIALVGIIGTVSKLFSKLRKSNDDDLLIGQDHVWHGEGTEQGTVSDTFTPTIERDRVETVASTSNSAGRGASTVASSSSAYSTTSESLPTLAAAVTPSGTAPTTGSTLGSTASAGQAAIIATE
mmetsp:Transcript_21804/g.44674  ORF Transcript_21804/g.44674 Transcript_21804/m.44674 type:complete len:499 (+) Transcript_21804:348-1844(+)